MRYRIAFRVDDGDGLPVVPERTVAFESGESLYERLTDALLVMARIIKSALDAAASRPDTPASSVSARASERGANRGVSEKD